MKSRPSLRHSGRRFESVDRANDFFQIVDYHLHARRHLERMLDFSDRQKRRRHNLVVTSIALIANGVFVLALRLWGQQQPALLKNFDFYGSVLTAIGLVSALLAALLMKRAASAQRRMRNMARDELWQIEERLEDLEYLESFVIDIDDRDLTREHLELRRRLDEWKRDAYRNRHD